MIKSGNACPTANFELLGALPVLIVWPHKGVNSHKNKWTGLFCYPRQTEKKRTIIVHIANKVEPSYLATSVKEEFTLVDRRREQERLVAINEN